MHGVEHGDQGSEDQAAEEDEDVHEVEVGWDVGGVAFEEQSLDEEAAVDAEDQEHGAEEHVGQGEELQG